MTGGALPADSSCNSGEVSWVYRDDTLLVADKPGGLLAVPGRGADKQDCLAARVTATYPHARVVHRLDMATSGLMLFALGVCMQHALSRLFHDRQVAKRYEASISGLPESRVGEISLPLMSDWPNRPLQKVDLQNGKPAITRYEVLTYDKETDTSRLVLQPVTGRTHQLRVHLAAIGHPIVGDTLYGGRIAARLMLHAARLGFFHPLHGGYLEWASAPPF